MRQLMVLLIACFSASPLVQTPMLQSASAVALLKKSATSMARSAPNDSSATGTINIVAGSTSDNGSIQIQTLGSDATSEQVTGSSLRLTTIYSAGQANEIIGSEPPKVLYMEGAASRQSVVFPLPLILGFLNSADTSYRDIGLESLNGDAVEHLRVSNTYTSQASLQQLASYTTKDIWINVSTFLPERISFLRFETGGTAAHGVPIDVSLSNYQNIGGVLYPSTIQESLDGTPWRTIQINTAAFNTGLSSSNFPIVQEAE
ncbi:MAG: hypothetical protein WA755_16710 [Candidatus Acidiferrales bacterium]